MNRVLAIVAVALAACGPNGGDGGGLFSSGAEKLREGFIDRGRGDPLIFDQACSEGQRVTIGAVGDVIIHEPNQRQALDEGKGYDSLWAPIAPYLKAVDVMYGNFEGTASCCSDPDGAPAADPGERYDGDVFTSFPTFNYHPMIAQQMADSGFDVVSTANNHALDRWADGQDETIDVLRAASLKVTGTRRAGASRIFHEVTVNGGISVAWLSCASWLNKREDKENQVLHCTQDRGELKRIIRELATEHDAVILTPHGGTQWAPKASQRMRDLAADAFDAGALVVLGSHPHVIEEWHRYRLEDGRDGFVFYSLSNYLTASSNIERRLTVLLFVGLTKDDAGVTHVNGATYLPVTTHWDGNDRQLRPFAELEGPENAASRAVAVGRLAEYNVHPAQPDIRTTPQCDSDFDPPPPHRGAVGDGCDFTTNCQAGLVCNPTWRDGVCTTECDTSEDCPTDPDRADPQCQDGVCLRACTSDQHCRWAYQCVAGACLPE